MGDGENGGKKDARRRTQDARKAGMGDGEKEDTRRRTQDAGKENENSKKIVCQNWFSAPLPGGVGGMLNIANL